MINQPSTEALNAAAYVENYLDSVENFPNEVQRLMSRIRELHVCYIAHVKEAEHWKNQAKKDPKLKQKCLLRMQIALSSAQEIGDEKMSVVQTMNDKVELRCRLLNQDLRSLEVVRDDSNQNENRDVPLPTSSGNINNSTVPLAERSNKRSRRGGRNDTYSENNNVEPTNEPPPKNANQTIPSSAPRKTSTGKKKKRKSRQNAQAQREDQSSKDEEPMIDPDEPTYCLCDQISYGEMIMCDNDLCPIEWFHFSCVSLATKPKGKWYCPKCRGDRPNVMKPKAQFLRELEKYNKEKEEKT